MANEAKIWARDGERFRNALRPGTVLETYDCGYLTVNAVTPDGVLVDTICAHDRLYDWETLERYDCLVYYQPAEDELPIRTVPKLRSRGGVVPGDTADDPGSEPGVAEERALARGLAALLSTWDFDSGSVRAGSAHVNGAWSCAAAGPAGEPIAAAELQDHVRALVARHRATPMAPQVGFSLSIEPRAKGIWYEIRFEYEGD